jgi:catechol 1,2-dioxygenase
MGPLTLPALAVAAVAAVSPPALILAAADEPGTRLELRGRVVDPAGAPLAGASLEVYQTDATGSYTPERAMDERHARLRGAATTDRDGRFVVRTIRPGGYPRPVKLRGELRHIPAHVHLDVRAPGLRERRLQVVFADDPRLADPYWAQWAKDGRHPVLTVRTVAGGQAAEVVVVLEREPSP